MFEFDVEEIQSLISIFVAIAVLSASFFQQFYMTWEKPVYRSWVKMFNAFMIGLLFSVFISILISI